MTPRVITVKFKPGDATSYSYFTDSVLIKPGDVVVVEARGSLSVVTVDKTFGLSKIAKDSAHSWVVQRVDMEAHRQKLDNYTQSHKL